MKLRDVLLTLICLHLGVDGPGAELEVHVEAPGDGETVEDGHHPGVGVHAGQLAGGARQLVTVTRLCVTRLCHVQGRGLRPRHRHPPAAGPVLPLPGLITVHPPAAAQGNLPRLVIVEEVVGGQVDLVLDVVYCNNSVYHCQRY